MIPNNADILEFQFPVLVLLGTLSLHWRWLIQTCSLRMAEVTFSFGQQTKRMTLSGTESEVAVQQELCSAFGFPPNTEITGIKNGNTGRVYSFTEVITRPGVIADSEALVLVGRRHYFAACKCSSLTLITKEAFYCRCNMLVLLVDCVGKPLSVYFSWV